MGSTLFPSALRNEEGASRQFPELYPDERGTFSGEPARDDAVPWVSIVVAAHNGAATLPATLRSLRRQSLPNWEAIIVDDGSTDATSQVAATWARRDGRFRAASQPWMGVAAARNRGIAMARAGWLMFLDCDDWLAPDALANLLRLARERPGAGVALGRAVVELPSGKRLPHARFDLSEPFSFLCAEGRIAIHSAIVRRALVEETGGFDPSLKSSEDWDLWQRLARTGAEFAQVDKVVAFYRNRPGSLSKDVLQVANDGLIVMRRGHTTDPRVPRPASAHARGAPESALGDRELYWVLWCAARHIALGGDGEGFCALLSGREHHHDASSLGELLANGMADVLAATPASLAPRWPEFAPKLERLLRELGDDRRSREALAIIKARLNGGRRQDSDSLQLERRAAASRPSGGAEMLQLRWGEKTLGAIAVPSAGEMSEAEFADVVTRGAALLPLRAALGALPAACAPALLFGMASQLSRAWWRSRPQGLSPADRRAWFRGALRRALSEALAGAVRSRFSSGGACSAHSSVQRARLEHWRDSAPERMPAGERSPFPAAVAGARGSKREPQPRAGAATAAPVLMYHRVAPAREASLKRYCVTPDMFEAQLRALRDAGFHSLSLAELGACLRFERSLPRKSVVLTFDDGYCDFATWAWPALQRYGFEATVFAVAGKVGGVADWDAAYGEPAPLMDWRTLRQLAHAGLDVQSHGLTHTRLTELEIPRLYDEALGSRAFIEAALGSPPSAFCYPYGARDVTAEQVLQACGFRLGVTIEPGYARLGDAELRISRVEIAGEDDLASFGRKLNLR